MMNDEKNINSLIKVVNLWKVFGDNPSIALEHENLDKSRADIQSEFGQVVALRNISFNVAKGQTFVVMGLSGSGKSTLVRCLIRLIDSTSGNIHIDGQDVTDFDDVQLREFRRTKISMVFQNFGLLPHRNVIDNACYGLEIKGIKKEERYHTAQKMLDLVGLKGWEEAKVNQLSGGMQQRVGLARALVVEPEILLMDEPFSGLDPLIRRQMRRELADLQREIQKTMVFITHDLDEAVSVGDKIAIMRDGEIIQMGTPDEIVLNPADDFVAEFTDDVSKEKILNLGSICIDPDLVLNIQMDIDELKVHMQRENADHIVFVDVQGSVLGAVTRTNVELSHNNEDLERHIKKSPPSLNSTTNIKDAISMMAQSQTPIPVIGRESELIGVITQQCLLQALATGQ